MGDVIRKYAYLEPVSIFTLIMAYIWDLRYSHRGSWLAILGLMLLSHRLHREEAKTLGFQSLNFRRCAEDFAPALILLALLMLGGGFLLQSTRPIGFDRGLLTLAGYLPWGVFQQYVLNGYFMNRLDRLVSHRTAPVVTAALFSGAHLPNWFLMAVTLLAGYCCARIYRRYKNLYFLGLAHATLGFLLYLVVPDSISHHLTVGPGWFLR
jgi:membrane protease YdiL (CAAX protease family)